MVIDQRLLKIRQQYKLMRVQKYRTILLIKRCRKKKLIIVEILEDN